MRNISILCIFLYLLTAGLNAQAKTATDNEKQANQFAAAADSNIEDIDLEDEFAEFEIEPHQKISDPLEGYNRLMTKVNDKLYYWVLKPTAKGYRVVVPESGRLAISRFFDNIMFPVRLVNNVLQLKLKGAGTECARFGVNTTIGILGFGDPAKNWLKLESSREDFGQTMGHYGVGGGFHIVLPLLGPSNLRDALGKIPDVYLYPVSHINNEDIAVGLEALRIVNNTSLHIGEYESLQKDAIDFYTFIRDSYEQNRDMQIKE